MTDPYLEALLEAQQQIESLIAARKRDTREGAQAETVCLNAIASNEACKPDDTLTRCTICGFAIAALASAPGEPTQAIGHELIGGEPDPVTRVPTEAMIEAGAAAMYGAEWNGPEGKRPGPKMKDVWRRYARDAIAGAFDQRDFTETAIEIKIVEAMIDAYHASRAESDESRFCSAWRAGISVALASPQQEKA